MDDLDFDARVLDFVKGVTTAMGLAMEATVEDTPDGPRVNLIGDDGELLLRHKAEGLQALQHITSVIFRDELPDNQRVVVDCLGFRKGKDSELRQMALFLGENLFEWKNLVALALVSVGIWLATSMASARAAA